MMGLSPIEYRQMTAREVQDWYNANRPRKTYGRMTEEQAQKLTDRIRANPDKYA